MEMEPPGTARSPRTATLFPASERDPDLAIGIFPIIEIWGLSVMFTPDSTTRSPRTNSC